MSALLVGSVSLSEAAYNRITKKVNALLKMIRVADMRGFLKTECLPFTLYLDSSVEQHDAQDISDLMAGFDNAVLPLYSVQPFTMLPELLCEYNTAVSFGNNTLTGETLSMPHRFGDETLMELNLNSFRSLVVLAHSIKTQVSSILRSESIEVESLPYADAEVRFFVSEDIANGAPSATLVITIDLIFQ